MCAHLDNLTTYVDPEALEKFRQETQGSFTGIGIKINRDPERDLLKVVTPIFGGPAYKAGLQSGDLITKLVREVDSQGRAIQPHEVIMTKGLSVNEAVKKILGKSQTAIRLTVERQSIDYPLEFEIKRGRVELETVLGVRRNRDDTWNYWLDEDKKIAYVLLIGLQRNTARDLCKVLGGLKRQVVKGFVLDLRFNPCGLLDSAIKVSDLFSDD